jgi:hypothetical protein
MTKTDFNRQLAYYEKWVDENTPEHGRTSCSDTNLYNAGTVTLRYRCERCESLSQLKKWKMTHGTKLKEIEE